MHPVLGYFAIARPLKTYKYLFFIYKKSFLPILYALQELSIKPNLGSKLIFVDRARDPGTGQVSERVQLTLPAIAALVSIFPKMTQPNYEHIKDTP